MGELELLEFELIKKILPSQIRYGNFDEVDIVVGFDKNDNPRYYSVREICESTSPGVHCIYFKLYKYVGKK